MKQFRKILGFELQNYLKNKIFVGVTLFLVLLIAVLMFFPRLMQKADTENGAPDQNPGVSDGTTGEKEDLPTLLLGFSENLSGQKETITAAFQSALPGYRVNAVKENGEGDESKVKSEIQAENAACGFFLRDLTSYTYYVNNLSLYDETSAVAEGLLQNLYRLSALTESGVSPETAQSILSTRVEGEVEILGKDQMKNFFYTYIMVFALYMVILLYGQMVATNVASEKSSRAMELLITSANPISMMFGKVLSSCLAGVLQLTAVFGSAFLFFNLNRSYFDESGIIASIFDMPLSLLLYMLTFFILGFFIYAFLFGAVGSTVSKLEDINTAVMPLTMLFIISFMVVVFSLSSGSADSLLMRICSYIPFTSSMAMFTRIAMSTVPPYEIALSVGILLASVVGVGILSAKIYRVGVLLYGKKPSPRQILRSIRKA